MKNRTTLFTIDLLAAMLASLPASAALATEYGEELRVIRQGLLDASEAGNARITDLEALADKAHTFVDANPGRAEPLIWEGIVLAELSAARRDMSSLGLVKRSRINFEAAEKIDPGKLGWSVYSLLAYLYAHVPGWPIGFGDKQHAFALYHRAIALNPTSAEPHRSYGEFLMEENNYVEAVRELSFALSAPLRVGEQELAAGCVCNASLCFKHTEETDAIFRDEVRRALDVALRNL